MKVRRLQWNISNAEANGYAPRIELAELIDDSRRSIAQPDVGLDVGVA